MIETVQNLTATEEKGPLLAPEAMKDIAAQIKKGEAQPAKSEASTLSELVREGQVSETKKSDYSMTFRLTDDMVDAFPYKPANVTRENQYLFVDVEFKEKTVTPRNEMRIMSQVGKLAPLFNDLNKDGSMDNMSEDEAVEMFLSHYDQFDLIMYNLAAAFLGVDDHYGEYMVPRQVFKVVFEIIDRHPELFNV